MNIKNIKVVLLVFVLSAVLSCNSNKNEEMKEVAIDKEQIKKQIQEKENEYAETYNSGVKKRIGYYADDATTFAQNRAPLVGKTAILDYLMEGLNSTNKDHKISFKTNEVFVSGDANQVVEVGHYEVVDSTNTPLNTGNYMVLFEKRDGNYYSVRDMSASDMPLK